MVRTVILIVEPSVFPEADELDPPPPALVELVGDGCVVAGAAALWALTPSGGVGFCGTETADSASCAALETGGCPAVSGTEGTTAGATRPPDGNDSTGFDA
mmetsp:Transcript_12996/g.24796  ORF Transcript_12996/g.24796 Transcript_12996/m.24796 type:complete len:101 (+) Transcript_12996:1097-1399(+)